MKHRVTIELDTHGEVVASCTCGETWRDAMMFTLVYNHLLETRP